MYHYVILFVLLSVQLFAQDSSPLLKSIQKKFYALGSFKVTLHQTISGKSINSGTLYYQKENKTKLELKNITIATDGITTWNFNKKDKKVILSRYKSNDISLISLPDLLTRIPASCKVTESVDSKGKLLTLVPLKTTLGFNKAELWVNSESLIMKIHITDSSNKGMDFELQDYQLNVSLPEAFFTYKEQPGIKTIDLR